MPRPYLIIIFQEPPLFQKCPRAASWLELGWGLVWSDCLFNSRRGDGGQTELELDRGPSNTST